jgi:hypothetical protein
MSFKRLKLFAPAVISILVFSLPLFTVFAQTLNGSSGSLNGSSGSLNGSSGGLNGSSGGGLGGPNTLQNPLGVNSICELIGVLLKAAIAIGIPIAVLFIVYAGFKFVMARGSPGELSEARANLVATLIGIAIFVGASLIANVIIATLEQLGVNGVNAC